MEKMQSRRSKNKCPWCGEREWNCYYCNGEKYERDGAEESFRERDPVIDFNENPSASLTAGHWVDECAYCGCVVS